uniref:Uncharacterized protein n=1 Tax=Anguilla anguilla TaxID=7936 RepID=A0A0E9W755_ANGAN
MLGVPWRGVPALKTVESPDSKIQNKSISLI